MFDNHTYSVLYGTFQKIEPFLTLWYVYLYFFKLYPRMAHASLVSQTYKRNPGAVKHITNKDVVMHASVIQIAVSTLMSLRRKKK